MLNAKNERDVVRSLERIADSLEKLVKDQKDQHPVKRRITYDGIRCGNCGRKLKYDSMFCDQCGEKVLSETNTVIDNSNLYADAVSAMNNYANNKEENKDGREN